MPHSNEFPQDLRAMRVLLTNDDGIFAPGLKSLQRIAGALFDDVWICAPEREQSGAGHSLTLHDPVRMRRVARRRFVIEGTPTDCALLGIHKALADRKPDLLLSGVNRGINAGEDITYSGTVAAAMEATLLGVPAIALSQQVENGRVKVHWRTAETHAPALLRTLLGCGWPKGTLLNINFPDVVAAEVRGVRATVQGQRVIDENLDERVDPRGRTYYWIGSQKSDEVPVRGSDLAAIAQGHVSVTPIHLDLTNRSAMERLEDALK